MSLKVHACYDLEIQKIIYKGVGLAKYEGMTVFVSQTLPGDKVHVKITKKKRHYAEGVVLFYHEQSSLRTKAFCQHFPICGGCQLADLTYANQLIVKKTILEDCFSRLLPKFLDIIRDIHPAKSQLYYRNKMEFSFYNKNDAVGLGLKQRGHFDKIVPIQVCYLQHKKTIDILLEVASFLSRYPFMKAWDYHTHEGVLRYLMLRYSSYSDVFMLNLVVAEDFPELYQDFANFFIKKQQIVSVYKSIQPFVSDTSTTKASHLLSGEPYLAQNIQDSIFYISPQSFFQTNNEGVEHLYALILEQAQLGFDDVVLDLYCGTGSIGIFLSKYVSKVIGIDEVPQAIDDARKNAEANQCLDKMTFYCGRVKTILKEKRFQYFFNCIIVDPPRSGMNPKAIQRMLALKPDRIVYVSCNMTTFCRDAEVLLQAGYIAKDFIPIDMFPNTFHLETVCCFFKGVING